MKHGAVVLNHSTLKIWKENPQFNYNWMKSDFNVHIGLDKFLYLGSMPASKHSNLSLNCNEQNALESVTQLSKQ